ncbi:MAG: hypothetical protein WBH99_06560 [Azovibrio sp.]|uniref:hypothetical protein n=1 Tax=Azovibrio sp. TaxID=1872673 RepID=UPI003C76CB92
MAVSKARIDWALLLLRLAVGGMAFLEGFAVLRHLAFPGNLNQAMVWGLNLTETLCGVLMVLGLWMPVASFILALIIGGPLILSWLNGAPVLGELHGLFLLLVAFAAALGGAGKWALGRN